MATHDNFLQYVLTPFSWLYGLGVYVRNKFFDWGILKETSFSVTVVGVGNITVGGT
ncbi:MAG: tetraacyldisaccharide 4'-kinase, partial [Muribaculaceae bacterium]|nr:tetraacyldisaccharide 4'-kinase [Muribaculaceae bacterium]